MCTKQEKSAENNTTNANAADVNGSVGKQSAENQSTEKKLKIAETSSPNKQPLKDRFLTAVVNGDIGRVENSGVIVSLKEFKAHFNDIKSDYINSFLPAATIETGQHSITTTKFLFRVKKGRYLVHPDVLVSYQR